jgi:hypothetical protein
VHGSLSQTPVPETWNSNPGSEDPVERTGVCGSRFPVGQYRLHSSLTTGVISKFINIDTLTQGNGAIVAYCMVAVIPVPLQRFDVCVVCYASRSSPHRIGFEHNGIGAYEPERRDPYQCNRLIAVVRRLAVASQVDRQEQNLSMTEMLKRGAKIPCVNQLKLAESQRSTGYSTVGSGSGVPVLSGIRITDTQFDHFDDVMFPSMYVASLPWPFCRAPTTCTQLSAFVATPSQEQVFISIGSQYG